MRRNWYLTPDGWERCTRTPGEDPDKARRARANSARRVGVDYFSSAVERYALPRKIKESTFTRAAKIAGVDREAIRDFCRGGEDTADPTAAELAAEYMEFTGVAK